MKIEKINDNQIKCILNKNDLIDRNMKPSELAYGSEKAASLFREMTEQAYEKFGFQTNNTPVMIEAIPLPNESIVLIITKWMTLRNWIPVFQNFLQQRMIWQTSQMSPILPTI